MTHAEAFLSSLKRPLLFFDLETTGTNTEEDRIVEIAWLKVSGPDSSSWEQYRDLVNPGVPIPAGATKIHGIDAETVKDAQDFAFVAPYFLKALSGCDLAGYNIRRFDVPLLMAELARFHQGLPADVKIVDMQEIFHKMEPRDLTAAVKRYAGREHEGAHGATADVLATLDVFVGQLNEYELPDVPAIIERFSDAVDMTGKLKWNEDGEAAISFGKHRGKTLREIDRGYFHWILNNASFPADFKELVRKALLGEYPKKDPG